MLTIQDIQNKLRLAVDGQLKHGYYDESVALASDIKETFSDNYPKFLEAENPRETQKDKKYKKDTYKNPIKGHLSRIQDKVIKIEQSENFLVNYPIDESGNNLLKDYCENNFNGSNNLVNWLFTKGTNAYVKNPNSVIAVLDINPPQSQTESFKPYPKVFFEEDVLEFEKNSHCVLRQKKSEDLTIYYFIDEVAYYIINHDTTTTERFTVQGPILHYCGVMPAIKVGKHILEVNSNDEELFKSLVSDSLPDFKKAISRSVFIEIEYNFHVHSLQWMMAPKKCPTCKGAKFENSKDGRVECRSCNGEGFFKYGNLDIMYIDAFEDSFLKGQEKFPFSSPGGNVPRDISAVQELTKGYYNHIDDAYDAIDFGILRKKDIASGESGLSKQYNRLEFSQRIYSEGRHLIENILMPIYRFIDAQLFGINPENSKLNRIPEVTIPISFDVMSPEMVLEEIKTARDANMSAEIVKTLELKYCKLVFGENSKESRNIIDEINLNPTLGLTVDEIVTLFGGGAGTQTNGLEEVYFVISSNYAAFIGRALREVQKWETFDNTQKWDILVGYANEFISKRPTLPTLPTVQVA